MGLLNEQMRDADVGNGDDDTFHQVVRDFSRMASDAPERLNRRSVPEVPQPCPTQPRPPPLPESPPPTEPPPPPSHPPPEE